MDLLCWIGTGSSRDIKFVQLPLSVAMGTDAEAKIQAKPLLDFSIQATLEY